MEKKKSLVVLLLLGLVLAGMGVGIGLMSFDLPGQTLGVIAALVTLTAALTLILAMRTTDKKQMLMAKDITLKLWGVLLGSVVALAAGCLVVSFLPSWIWLYKACPVIGASFGCFVVIVVLGELG